MQSPLRPSCVDRSEAEGVEVMRLTHGVWQRETKQTVTCLNPSRCVATGPALGSHACVALSSEPATIIIIARRTL